MSGLPGALTVAVQDDNGAASGLGTLATTNLGAPPNGSAYGLPNQYNAAISVFSYTSPQSTEPVTVTISPPPGVYDGAILISFTTLNAADQVFYRVGTGDSWHSYASTFPLTNDNTIQYYGTNASLRAPFAVAIRRLLPRHQRPADTVRQPFNRDQHNQSAAGVRHADKCCPFAGGHDFLRTALGCLSTWHNLGHQLRR